MSILQTVGMVAQGKRIHFFYVELERELRTRVKELLFHPALKLLA